MKTKSGNQITPTNQTVANLIVQGWKFIKDELPFYYTPVNLWDGNVGYHNNMSRVSEGETMYYVTTDPSINTVFSEKDMNNWMWKYSDNKPREKYEPMILEDLPGYKSGFEAAIKLAIKKLKKKEIPYNIHEPEHISYYEAKDDCIIILKDLLKGSTLPAKSNSTNVSHKENS